MHTIIIAVHVIVAIVLVFTVLLQAGKGAGMGAAFGGSSGSVFGSRGPTTLISKITCAAAVIFMCTSLNLAIFQGGSNSDSVLDQYSQEDVAINPANAPAAPAEALATPAPPVAAPESSEAEAAPAE
jgi:preprotein translocase subunit SecG